MSGNQEAARLSSEEVRLLNAYWRAANYLSVGQIYLFDNPLLREPLKLEPIKPRLLGHWGTTPGFPATSHRRNHVNLHVRGYKEEGTTTTPFEMVVLNDLDRYRLVMDVIERVPKLESFGAHLLQQMRDKRFEHKRYITEYGEDMPEIRDWKWPY